jgi:cytochrome c biogenesis protein CcdA
MFRLAGLVLTIGLADSLNPSTIAPALYLASGPHARAQVARFTLGVFLVYLVGGALVAFGPGELVLALVPRPHHVARHILEVVAGVIVLAASIFVWRNRRRLSERARPADGAAPRRSGLVLGVTITAVELPTAFPYFAAIAAIVGADTGAPRAVFLLLVFNVAFIVPLLAILATLWLAGDRAVPILARARDVLHRHWPWLLSGALLIAAVISLFVGVTGLLVAGHGDVNNTARTLREILHLSKHP